MQQVTRRYFLQTCQLALGALAMGPWERRSGAEDAGRRRRTNPLAPKQPPNPARAKHVIYLHMEGSPPQQDLFDYKPALVKHNMEPCPDELLNVLKQERLAFIDLKQRRPQLLGTPHKFDPAAKSGMLVSQLLPEFRQCADDICLIRSMHTDQFNHAPAELLLHTGAPRFGNASMGSWVTYGLGSENENLPGFVVLVSGGTDPTGGKSLWGSGFLPSVYQGVQCRAQGDPILYVGDPAGMSRDVRRRSLDALKKLNEIEFARHHDPETQTRISQYELAFRMQMSVPEVMDLSREPQAVQEAYGGEPGKESFANNCLLARRLVEHGVRFVQLFDYGWDMHGTGQDNDLVTGLPNKCREIDRPLAALHARPETARPVGRDAVGLERRIRPHVAERSPQRLHVPGPRPPPALRHDLAGRRRDSPRTGGRRHRRTGLLHHGKQDRRARPAGHDPAPAGARSLPLQLSLSGPEPAADRPDRRRTVLNEILS